MHRPSLRGASFPVLVLLLASLAPPGHAADLHKNAFSGGAVEAAGSHGLRATVAEAGVVGASAAGNVRLSAGFWMPAAGVATSVSPLPPETPAFESPAANRLYAPSPNPVAGAALLHFTLAGESAARLALYDVTGRRVRLLAEGRRPAGRHQVAWDGRDDAGRRVASGIYFLRLEADSWSAGERLLVIR